LATWTACSTETFSHLSARIYWRVAEKSSDGLCQPQTKSASYGACST
jgi:hypothetical protein